MAKCNCAGAQWMEYSRACSEIDPYLAVVYDADIYQAWLDGKTPEQAISEAREQDAYGDEW